MFTRMSKILFISTLFTTVSCGDLLDNESYSQKRNTKQNQSPESITLTGSERLPCGLDRLPNQSDEDYHRACDEEHRRIHEIMEENARIYPENQPKRTLEELKEILDRETINVREQLEQKRLERLKKEELDRKAREEIERNKTDEQRQADEEERIRAQEEIDYYRDLYEEQMRSDSDPFAN